MNKLVQQQFQEREVYYLWRRELSASELCRVARTVAWMMTSQASGSARTSSF